MKPDKWLAPVLIAVVVGIIAAFGVWVQEPWLAPSLGSAVFAQVLTPKEAAAKPYSICVGQFLGAIAGFIAVFVAGATTTPQYMNGHTLMFARVVAAVIAVLLAAVLQLAASATTPAGAATAVIVAVGAETASVMGAFHLAVGILLVTILGEAARRTVLRARTEPP